MMFSRFKIQPSLLSSFSSVLWCSDPRNVRNVWPAAIPEVAKVLKKTLADAEAYASKVFNTPLHANEIE